VVAVSLANSYQGYKIEDFVLNFVPLWLRSITVWDTKKYSA